ncbi:hypothetical protein GQX74_005602 [Glossina fuscipes]|nr:hypothetical protein GQX74_005602 [Glossina fuscipes]
MESYEVIIQQFVGFILIVIRFIWQIITEYTCFVEKHTQIEWIDNNNTSIPLPITTKSANILNLTWARINQQGVVKRDYPPVRHVAYQSGNWLTKHILGGSPSRQARAHSSGADSAGLRLNSAVALVEKSKCLNGDLGLGLTTVLLAANEG